MSRSFACAVSPQSAKPAKIRPVRPKRLGSGSSHTGLSLRRYPVQRKSRSTRSFPGSLIKCKTVMHLCADGSIDEA